MKSNGLNFKLWNKTSWKYLIGSFEFKHIFFWNSKYKVILFVLLESFSLQMFLNNWTSLPKETFKCKNGSFEIYLCSKYSVNKYMLRTCKLLVWMVTVFLVRISHFKPGVHPAPTPTPLLSSSQLILPSKQPDAGIPLNQTVNIDEPHYHQRRPPLPPPLQCKCIPDLTLCLFIVILWCWSAWSSCAGVLAAPLLVQPHLPLHQVDRHADAEWLRFPKSQTC